VEKRKSLAPAGNGTSVPQLSSLVAAPTELSRFKSCCPLETHTVFKQRNVYTYPSFTLDRVYCTYSLCFLPGRFKHNAQWIWLIPLRRGL
jgi:hypothetical protein